MGYHFQAYDKLSYEYRNNNKNNNLRNLTSFQVELT